MLSGVNSRAVDLTKLHSKTAAFRRLQHDTTAQLYSAASGPEALNILESEEPDLILLDVLMPNMNGYQVCRRIRENPAMQTVPVIMMTGLDPSEEKAKGRDVGATDIIVKPIHLADLLERLHFLGIRGDDERSNGA